MSQRDIGKPKEPRRGRPSTGRDPVVAVRLPHEAIADVDRLARTLGLSSRSDAIRYMIIRSTASIEPREIDGGLSLGLPTEIRSKERKRFQIEVFVARSGEMARVNSPFGWFKGPSRQHACATSSSLRSTRRLRSKPCN